MRRGRRCWRDGKTLKWGQLQTELSSVSYEAESDEIVIFVGQKQDIVNFMWLNILYWCFVEGTI